MMESKVRTAGYLFISLLLALSCITVYIGKESRMLIHAGRNGPAKKEEREKQKDRSS